MKIMIQVVNERKELLNELVQVKKRPQSSSDPAFNAADILQVLVSRAIKHPKVQEFLNIGVEAEIRLVLTEKHS